jgi:hypothetical protein
MIRNDNQKGNDTMSNTIEYGAVKVGQNITATRKDGRVFEGTMVTIQSSAPASYYDEYNQRDITVTEPVYKNVYLEDCKSWVVWENEEMYWNA